MTAATKETKKQLSQLRDLLKRDGYKVEEPQSGWLWVIVEEFSYLIEYSDEDPEFFQLEFPMGLDDKDSRKDEYQIAINNANARSKLAKAYLTDDNDLNIVVDVMASTPKEFVAYFARYISAIQSALNLITTQVGG